MLKEAFNSLTQLHSRPGQIRRPGTVDMYSPCRLTPANYFRYLAGPDSTVIHGREFIIPIDTLRGQFAQTVVFEAAPASGTFKLSYNALETTDIPYNETTPNIQTALRLVTGLSNVVITGTIASGLIVTFAGFSTTPLILVPTDSTLQDLDLEDVTITATQTYALWGNRLKRSDKIIDSVFGLLTIDEVTEMVDLGGAVMGVRIRCE